MATHNVRFYKLDQMPTFDPKHRGIFVWIPVQGNDNGGHIVKGYDTIDTSTNPFSHGNEVHFTGGIIEPGLWFGGNLGWELLTNIGDGLTEAQVNTLIDAKLAELDAEFDIVNVQTSGNTTTVTFYGVEQLNGLVKQGNDASDMQQITIGNGKLRIGKSDGSDSDSDIDDAVEVFSANSTTDAAIELGNGLTWDKNNMVIGVDTKTAVSGNNKIVTEADIAGLAGAMHYKGALDSNSTWPSSPDIEEGDVYIITGQSFTHGTDTLEAGDLVVFKSDGTYKVVQSNLTLGVGSGQIAANDGALTAGDIVYATGNGIATYNIQPSDIALKSSMGRTLSLSEPNTGADSEEPSLQHSVDVTDTLTIGSTTLAKTLSIATPNQSIDLQTNPSNVSGDPEITIDLVWKEHIDL